MSYAKPWMTANELVAAIKRKILLPTSQNTFSTDDILSFINEELTIGLVPEILSFNEEYFVFTLEVPIVIGKTRYPIPSRAIGMKLRDMMWKDGAGNIYEMTRVSPDDKSYFQKGINYNNSIEKFYIEGNDIVLCQAPNSLPTGTFMISFYMRPNKLVRDNRSAIIHNFKKQLTIGPVFKKSTDGDELLKINDTEFVMKTSNGSIHDADTGIVSEVIPGLDETTIISTNHGLKSGYKVFLNATTVPALDPAKAYTVKVIDESTFTIPFSTVSAPSLASIWTSPNLILFGIGGDNSTLAGNNLISKINQESTYTIDSSYNVSFSDINTTFESTNPHLIKIPATVGVEFESLPTTDYNSETGITQTLFAPGALVDFIQTVAGHQLIAYDVPIPTISAGNTIFFNEDELPSDLVLGDCMCIANECIIPQIPSDLHTALADKASARILAAIGDNEGLNNLNMKLAQSAKAQGFLIDNRVEGAPLKINTNHTLLRFQKWTYRRRF